MLERLAEVIFGFGPLVGVILEIGGWAAVILARAAEGARLSAESPSLPG
jgi:hypothetical protein